jgi:hypothetical protein
MNPIPVEYADGMVTEESEIRYLVNLQIRGAGKMVLTRVLVTRLKSFKLFLGFDWLQVVNTEVDWRKQVLTTKEEEEVLPMRSTTNGCPDYKKMFPQVFLEEAFKELPTHRKWDHAIKLVEGASPHWGCCYPLSQKEDGALKEFIQKNEDTGKIQKSNSPFASPLFFRPKQGTDKLRRIQDYRGLNAVTVKDRYPLPLISQVIRQIKNSNVFSKIDLRWGFNNIQIQEGDENKAVFITPRGLFKPLVMQFRLCNTPSMFQRMVDEILKDEKEGGQVEVYIGISWSICWTGKWTGIGSEGC